MKREVPFNLIGVIPVPRTIFTLVNQKILTQSDLFWYVTFASQAEFGHKFTTIGVITAGDRIIAEQLGNDPTTVNKKRNKLIKLGLLKNDPDGTKVANYQMFTENKKSSVVPVTTSVLRKGEQKDAANLFRDEEQFMKKRQELIENQSHKLTQNT